MEIVNFLQCWKGSYHPQEVDRAIPKEQCVKGLEVGQMPYSPVFLECLLPGKDHYQSVRNYHWYPRRSNDYRTILSIRRRSSNENLLLQ